MTWKVTESTLHGKDDRRDTLVNMFNTSSEAIDAVQDLERYTQGTHRQFSHRLQFKSVPAVRHWKGVRRGGLVEYFETWDEAMKELKNDRDLCITMVEGSSESELPKMLQPVPASESKAFS